MYDVKPVTTPNAKACGPAALKMLLAYYSKDADLDALIRECRIGVAGCSAKTLKQVGDAHGLDITMWKMDADELLKQDRPAIIWWRYTHYVVFCGLNEQGEPVICNSECGRYPISRDTFKRAYSGIGLFNGHPQECIDTGDYFGEHTPEPDYYMG